jgi:alginate O-acetyltransferase complex protein AlgJ
MFNAASLRYRYTQFFLLFLFFSLIYVMTQSIAAGLDHFQENFYKRNFLIEKANAFRIKLGDRVLPISLIGKDGWVDYTGDGNIDDFQNLKPFPNKKNLYKKIKNLDRFLRSQGITFLIVVAPNKATIYPDKLPDQIKSVPTPSRLDQFITYFQKHHLPIVVDLRPALRTARKSQDMYFPGNNTHWNGYGAFVAYTTIIDALRSSYPELKPYEPADLKLMPANPHINIPGPYFVPKNFFVQTVYPSNDNGLNKFLVGGYGYDQFSSIPDSTLPTLLMFHDSFGAYYLNDYLSMNFGKSHFVHLISTAQYLSKETIQQFNPDVIIIQIVERDLDLLVNTLINFGSK